jgi:hypothetical protein
LLSRLDIVQNLIFTGRDLPCFRHRGWYTKLLVRSYPKFLRRILIDSKLQLFLIRLFIKWAGNWLDPLFRCIKELGFASYFAEGVHKVVSVQGDLSCVAQFVFLIHLSHLLPLVVLFELINLFLMGFEHLK